MSSSNIQLDTYIENTSNYEISIAIETLNDWLNTWFNYLDLDLDLQGTYEISLRLTDDREIQEFNRQFRNLDKATDVLSFASLEDDIPMIEELETISLGDIIISLETALKQAELEGHDLKTELAWLTSHGLLHLLGWDHPDDDSLAQMLTQQAVLLIQVGVEPPSVKKYFS